MTRTFQRREWMRSGWLHVIFHVHTVDVPEVLGTEQSLTLGSKYSARRLAVVSSRLNDYFNPRKLHSCEVGRGRDLRDATPAVSSFKSGHVCLTSDSEAAIPVAECRMPERGVCSPERLGVRRERTWPVLRDEELATTLSLAVVPPSRESDTTDEKPAQSNLRLSLVRGSSAVEQVAHNHTVGGSIPPPATTFSENLVARDGHTRPLGGTRTHTPASTSIVCVLP